MLSEKSQDKLLELLDSFLESAEKKKKIEDYINGNIDKDMKENEEKWASIVRNFIDPIFDFVQNQNKASTQMAILNGVISELDKIRKSVFQGVGERFENE